MFWVLFDASFVMSAQKNAVLADPISTFYLVGIVGSFDT
jgi:hypothetical protein